MYYERIRDKEQEQVKEKESDSDIEELSMNQSSEDFQQLTNNKDIIQDSAIPKEKENPQKDINTYLRKDKLKNYFSPYLSQVNFDYDREKVKKENNYLTNKNISNNTQKNPFYNENIIRKNETEINKYHTEENNDTNHIYLQNDIMEKKELNNTKNRYKQKNTKKLNFSYDENVNKFDNYNKIRNVKDIKEYMRNEYNNNNFSSNQKSDPDIIKKYNNQNSENEINNNQNHIAKISEEQSNKKIYYYNNNIKFENNKNENMNNYNKKLGNQNAVNSPNDFKNDKEKNLLRKQLFNKTFGQEMKMFEKENLEKPNYFFSYDLSPKIKNYDIKNKSSSEISTALDTAKYQNYREENNAKIKEFNVIENENQKPKEKSFNSVLNINNNYELNHKEKSYINNLKTLKIDINNAKTKANTIIKKYIDNEAINNSINNKKDLETNLKYYNSTNNLIIQDVNENEKLSSLFRNENFDTKIISASTDELDESKKNKYQNYIRINHQKDEIQNINNTPQRKEPEIPQQKNQIIQDPYNLNTLESAMIRSMDEEEEVRTLELEKELQKLDELEKEKQKLILEEKERRERILIEIKRQEMQEKEKKQLMRKKYDEKMRKKKEDEEKLKKIREEQQKQLREIIELKNNRKNDEQKLLLLSEGKLNKKQRSDYFMGIANKTMNFNDFPFKINVDENNNNFLIDKMKNNNIDRNSNYWNYKTNIIKNTRNNSINNSVEEDENFEENIIKDNNDFEEIENNSNEQEEKKLKSIKGIGDFLENKNVNIEKEIEHDISKFNNNKGSITIYKPKNRRMNINNSTIIKKDKEDTEYKTFSPKITHNNNVNTLSPVTKINNDKISTELPDFSSKKIIKDKISEKDSGLKKNDINEVNENTRKNLDDSIHKDYYEKKKFNFGKKQINKEKNIKTKTSDYSKKGSFAKLNELREITSKLANEVEKKIQLINKNKLFSKAKSSSKLSDISSKYEYKYLKINLEADTKNNNELNLDKNKENKKNEINSNDKVKKYNQLIKDTKIEITNIINNQNQTTKKKFLVPEKNLPEEIKKECISDLKTMESFTKKRSKENSLFHTGKVNKQVDTLNRNKNIGTIKNFKTLSNLNQKAFYNDFLYGNKKKIQGQEIDQKFLPYYKEIYGEATPEKDN